MASKELNECKAAMVARRAAAAGEPAPTLDQARARLEETMTALPEVGGATTEPVMCGTVPAELIRPDSGAQPAGTLLYLHGGGYTVGSLLSHRRVVTSLCLASGARGLSVAYRLAPEDPFPAAVDDAVTAYKWLIGPGGESPSRVVVSGDSAGGGLSMALLVRLRGEGLPPPAGAFLISAWTDLAATGASLQTRAEVDPMLVSIDELARKAAQYAGPAGVRDPLVSPLYADLSGLPPLLIHVGDAEVLLDDSTRLAERAQQAGVPVEQQVWPEAFHDFHMYAGVIPEADEAIAQAGAWIAKRMTSDHSG